MVVTEFYTDTPTTKIAHSWRELKVCHVQRLNSFLTRKSFKVRKNFWEVPQDKQRFIDLLTERLANSGCKVQHAQDDARVLVVRTSVSCAETLLPNLIRNDTNILVLLQYHARIDACGIFTQTDTHKNSRRLYDIQRIKNKLETEAVENLLVCQAMSGCDTTSRLYGVGDQEWFPCHLMMVF